MQQNNDSPPARQQSDRPSQSFDKERDAFVETFFKKGAKFAQDLLRENEQMRQRLSELETENAAMRLQIKSDEAIRDLLRKIQDLEREKLLLVSQFKEAEAKSSEVEMTYAEVESELANLASLYVAARQLHATMRLSGVIRQLREILEQFVGARTYGVYFLSDDAAELVHVAGRGLTDAGHVRIKPGTGPIGEAFASGTANISEEGDVHERDVERPAACIPMRIEDRIVGVIAIVATFEQKTRFLPVDYEFFKLLSGHAASAIVAARLFAEADRQIPGIESFLEHGV
jgi:putative methionine-R-sulfoxide reductase with GAF domain